MRRRYKYDTATGSMVEVGIVRAPAPRIFFHTDAGYEGLRATDGTRLDTRRKHEQYMKDHGLALYDDYKDTFAKAQEERERDRMGVGPRDESLHEDVSKAYQMVRDGYRPPPRPEGDDDATVSSYIVGKDV